MKKIFVLLIIVVFGISVFAQEVKTYKGKMSSYPVKVRIFDIPFFSPEGGVWSYQYYENEKYERVFHGKLTYNYKFGNDGIYTISGQYEHGKKEGQWIYQAVRGKSKILGKCVVNYKDGLLSGPFYYYVEHIKMSGGFSNDHPVGKVTCSSNDISYSGVRIAFYNEYGYPDSVWTHEYTQSSIAKKTIVRFINNCLVSTITIDQSTGERKIYEAKNVDIANYQADATATSPGDEYLVHSNEDNNEPTWYSEKYRGDVLIPLDVASQLSNTNKHFHGKDQYYTLVDGRYSDLEREIGFSILNEVFRKMGCSTKCLKIIPDDIRNDEVEDSIAAREALEKKRLQEEQKAAEMERLQEEQKAAEKERLQEEQRAREAEIRRIEREKVEAAERKARKEQECMKNNLLYINMKYKGVIENVTIDKKGTISFGDFTPTTYLSKEEIKDSYSWTCYKGEGTDNYLVFVYKQNEIVEAYFLIDAHTKDVTESTSYKFGSRAIKKFNKYYGR